jgi:alkylation response protein AidB-like acyl-CoA dehydrogenase
VAKGVAVPDSAAVGLAGNGLTIPGSRPDAAALTIGACSTGSSEAALVEAVSRACATCAGVDVGEFAHAASAPASIVQSRESAARAAKGETPGVRPDFAARPRVRGAMMSSSSRSGFRLAVPRVIGREARCAI